MFLLGMTTSAILSEAVTIFHEFLKEWTGINYPHIRLVVFLGCLILLGYVFYIVNSEYLQPLDKIDDQLNTTNNNKR